MLSVPQFSKHNLIFICYDFKIVKAYKIIKYRDFKNIKFEILYNSFEEIPWEYMYTIDSVNQQVEFLQEKIILLYNEHVPLKAKTIKCGTRPWFNVSTKNAINATDSAYRS